MYAVRAKFLQLKLQFCAAECAMHYIRVIGNCVKLF